MQAELDRGQRQLQQRGNLAQAQVLEVAKHDDFAKRFGQLGGRLANNFRFRLEVEAFGWIRRGILAFGKSIAEDEGVVPFSTHVHPMKVRKYAVQPGKERAVLAVLPYLGDGMGKGTKDKILRVIVIAANADGGAEQPVAILDDQTFCPSLGICRDIFPNLHF